MVDGLMPSFNVDLSGHNALVTGAGAGIGRAIALALAHSGASVAVNDLNIERAEDVTDEITAQGKTAVALHGDISNRFHACQDEPMEIMRSWTNEENSFDYGMF